jgi:hypothetical protein
MIFIIDSIITLLITIVGISHLEWSDNLSFGLRLGMPLGDEINGMVQCGVTPNLKVWTPYYPFIAIFEPY